MKKKNIFPVVIGGILLAVIVFVLLFVGVDSI